MRRSTTLILMFLALAWPDAPAQSAEPNPPAKRPPAAPIAYAKPNRLTDLANKTIKESSGLACSRRRKNVFWTHNDSGDNPRIYAFNNKGEDLGTFDVAGARAVDWEDMASVRLGKTPYLLLADVGDNNARRKNCTLYFVKEPALPAGRKPVQGKVKIAKVIRFKYPDGPQNCEAVAVDPTTRTVYIITKSAKPIAKVYSVRIRKGKDKGVIVAWPVSALPHGTVTGMDISPDGARCIVVTYGPAYEYTRQQGEKWADAFARKPREITMPARTQGESICYGTDGKTLYLTSEKLPTPLWEVPVTKQEDNAER